MKRCITCSRPIVCCPPGQPCGSVPPPEPRWKVLLAFLVPTVVGFVGTAAFFAGWLWAVG